MDGMKTFQERLRETREERGLKQVELAERIGLSGQSAIGNMERDSKRSGSRHIAALAAALGVNALWLETGRGPKEANMQAPAILKDYLSPIEHEIVFEFYRAVPPEGQTLIRDFAAQVFYKYNSHALTERLSRIAVARTANLFKRDVHATHTDQDAKTGRHDSGAGGITTIGKGKKT